MTIETIDNVLYYVWRAGDELPKYQPKQVSGKLTFEPFFRQ
jgi:hypothetical protein